MSSMSIGRKAFARISMVASLGMLLPAAGCKNSPRAVTPMSQQTPTIKNVGSLVKPDDFPRVSVTATAASFTVRQSEQLKINPPKPGKEYEGANGLYAVIDGKHVGYLAMDPKRDAVLLFNLAGNVVASLEAKSDGVKGVWLPANKPLTFRDADAVVVKASALPWETRNDSFGVRIEGQGLETRIVEVVK